MKRSPAGLLALLYLALAAVAPLAHAREAARSPTPALEGQHGVACVVGHDPATCPLAHLTRAAIGGQRSAVGPAQLRRVRAGAGPVTERLRSTPATGVNGARAPPAILDC